MTDQCLTISIDSSSIKAQVAQISLALESVSEPRLKDASNLILGFFDSLDANLILGDSVTTDRTRHCFTPILGAGFSGLLTALGALDGNS